MLSNIKRIIKNSFLRTNGLCIDYLSDINRNVKYGKNCKIVNSHVSIEKMGNGCFVEHVYAYGQIQVGNHVSISGPGTILHSECGKITIGSFTSIAANVSIQEFNHKMNRPTTYAINYSMFDKPFLEDCDSKGDIVIGEDVWIGSNSVILSGVNIGRGSVVAAGSVVTKDIPPYVIVAGVPARVIRKRFADETVNKLESSKWWLWSDEEILRKQEFFKTKFK